MKQTTTSAGIAQNPVLSAAFFEMPIDIQGGNIGQVGWQPTKEDFKFIGDDFYNEALAEFVKANEKVCFKNTHLNWDSCDCGDGYGCSHGSWVYEINVTDENGRHTIDMQDDDSLYFENKVTGKQCVIPLTASVGDFHRACQMCGINLELTDYALTLSAGSR